MALAMFSGCQRRGASVVGEELGVLSATSYDVCQHLCVLHTGCAFWAFDNSLTTQNCRMYSERSTYVESTSPDDGVAGPAVCNANGECIHASQINSKSFAQHKGINSLRFIFLLSAEVCYEHADYVGHDLTDGGFGTVNTPGELSSRTSE